MAKFKKSMNFVEWVVQLQLRTWVFTDLGRKWEREDDCEPGITDVMILKAKKKKRKEKKGVAIQVVGSPSTKTKVELVKEAAKELRKQTDWASESFFPKESTGKHFGH